MKLVFLRLIRFSLAPTLIGDLAAGLAWSSAPFQWGSAHWLTLLTSFALFSGGMSLNACVDIEADGKTRPDRPLPSGDMHVPTAWAAVVLGLGGPLIAWWVLAPGSTAAAVVLALVLLIVAYHSPLRHQPRLGPLTLGAVRGTHFVLGAAAIMGFPAWSMVVPPAVAYGMYVTGASLVAHQEDRKIRLSAVRSGVLLAFLSMSIMIGLIWFRGPWQAIWLPILATALLVWRMYAVHRLQLLGSAIGPKDVGMGARVLLGQMAIITSALAFGAGSWFWGLIGLFAFFAVRLLVRWIPPT